MGESAHGSYLDSPIPCVITLLGNPIRRGVSGLWPRTTHIITLLISKIFTHNERLCAVPGRRGGEYIYWPIHLECCSWGALSIFFPQPVALRCHFEVSSLGNCSENTPSLPLPAKVVAVPSSGTAMDTAVCRAQRMCSSRCTDSFPLVEAYVEFPALPLNLTSHQFERGSGWVFFSGLRLWVSSLSLGCCWLVVDGSLSPQWAPCGGHIDLNGTLLPNRSPYPIVQGLQ